MPRIPLPLPLLGLRDETPAGATEPTHYDGGENLCDYDHRSGRVGLASRPGLTSVGTAAVAPALIHPVTRPLQRDAWAELSTTAATGTVPAEVQTAWTVDLEGKPIAQAVGPLGNGYTLLESGVVVVTSPTGKRLATFSLPVPNNFRVVPEIAIDEDGRLYGMSAYARRIDGGAGRLHRMSEVDNIWRSDGDAVIEWRPVSFVYDRGELLVTAQRPDDWNISPEADGVAPDEQLFRFTAIQGTPVTVWEVPAATPTVNLDVNDDGDVYVSSAPNASRVPTGSAPGTISVGWIPREAIEATEGVDAAHGLYAHYSALRAQALQGLVNETAVARLIGATHDESDFPEVFDARRDLVTPASLGATPPNINPGGSAAALAFAGIERRPVFDVNGFSGVPAFVFNGARCFVTGTSTGFHEKETVESQATHSQCIFPNMRDASGQGAHFVVCILFRIEEVDAADPARYVFHQTDYSLTYIEDGGGNIDFEFTYPGGTSTLTLTGITARALCFTFVHAGHGDANSAWYLHDAGTTFSATGLTVNIPRAIQRTVLGGYTAMAANPWIGGDFGILAAAAVGAPFNFTGRYRVGDIVWHGGRAWTCIADHASNDLAKEPGVGASTGTYWAVVDALGLNGAIAECVTFLGGSSAATSPHDTAVGTTLRQKLEGFVTNAYGRQGILPAAHPYDAAPPAGTGDHAFDASQGLYVAAGITAKYARADGRVVWVDNLVSGAGVTAAPDGYLFTASLVVNPIGGAVRVRKKKDEGTSVRGSGTDVYSITDSETGGTWLGSRIRMTSDHLGDLYLPYLPVEEDDPNTRSLRRYRSNGLGGTVTQFVYQFGDGAYPLVAVPAGAQVSLRDISGAGGAEFVYVAVIDDTPTGRPTYSVRRVDVLGRARTTELRDREVQTLIVGRDGRVEKKIDSGAVVSVAGAGTLGTDRPWAVNMLGKVYLGGADTEFKVYDPRLGTLTAWEVDGRSARPRRLTLGTRWRNRIMGVDVDNQHVVHASAVRKPLDWDAAPLVLTATQAFAGTNAASGNSPEPITALIPWADDLCLMGSAEGIVRITGDPVTGGQLDDVAAQDGIAYGYAWTRGPGDTLYWLSSRGKLIQATPGGGLKTISSGAVGKRLREIDLTRYRAELAWSNVPEGVFVFLYPRGTAPELDVLHYFIAAGTGAWHPVRFVGGHERMLTAAAFVSADRPVDSGLVLGFADGALRRFDPEAWDDDGEPLRWWARIPIATNAAPGETVVTDAELVTSDFGGVVRVGGLAARTATAPGAPMSLVDCPPGRGDLAPIQVAGPYVWLWLEGSEPAAVYDLAVYASGGGSKR